MFRRTIIAAMASLALVVATGGTALACVVDTPPDDVCYGTPIHHDEEGHTATIVDQEAYDDDPTWVEDEAAHWQRYSANGSWKNDYAPDFPSDYWQPNVKGDPHGIGHAGAYDVSNEHSGNVDWFYLEWVDATGHEEPGEHHDAVTHEEWVVDVEAWDEPVIVPCDDDEPIVVTPTFHYVEPTCFADGFIDVQGPAEGIHWDVADNLDGTFVYTAVLDPGFAFPEGFNLDDANFYVPSLAQLAEDSDECYTPPPPPEVCEDGQVAIWHTWTGGPRTEDQGPAADEDGWNANSGNPQSANHRFSDHTAGVPYFVSNGNSGNGDWFLWTLEDCPSTVVPVPALFSAPVGAPTCDQAGSFLVTNNFPNVNVTVSPAITGPGTYTLTFTLVGENVEWPDGTTAPKVRVITIDPATGVTQSTNAAAPCYLAPPPPPGNPPVVTPPVTILVPPTVTRATPVVVRQPARLASTGSDGTLALGVLAGLLILAGGSAATVVRRRRG